MLSPTVVEYGISCYILIASTNHRLACMTNNKEQEKEFPE